MRTAITCLALLSACSCSQVAGPSGAYSGEAAAKRREQVRQIVFGESKEGPGAQVRGPLTLAQAEREVDKRIADLKRTAMKETEKIIAQVEEALHKITAQSDDATRKELAELKLKECLASIRSQMKHADSSSGTKSPEWREFRMACEAGDEIYYVKSGPQSSKESGGTEQYVLLRQDKVQNTFEITVHKQVSRDSDNGRVKGSVSREECSQ
jgi:hypothetical protein